MDRKIKEILKNMYRFARKKTVFRLQSNKNKRFAEDYYIFHGYGIKSDKKSFIEEFSKEAYSEPLRKSKAVQFKNFVDKIEIKPYEGYGYFYSLDTHKGMEHDYPVLTNYSLDYSLVVNSSFRELKNRYIDTENDQFAHEMNTTIDALKIYLDRIKNDNLLAKTYQKQIAAIETLWERKAETMFEALQRILFLNQFMWQTGHNDIGLGHLDWILEDVYQASTDREDTVSLITEFCKILHEEYLFKSALMPGDTGQYILLGGLSSKEHYRCNGLTYIFLRVGIELRLPDPKTILRYSKYIPEDLLDLALESIKTGIGAPLLSNDDEVVKDLISAGIDEKDAYQYATSACWEPLIPQKGCDQNNSSILNFVQPLVTLLEGEDLEKISSLEEFVTAYEKRLEAYLNDMLGYLSTVRYEEDTILTLFSECALKNRRDFLRGGAVYNNTGITSTGLGNVVNSILNIEKLVWNEERYSLTQLNDIRLRNFEGNNELLSELKSVYPCYGSDDSKVIELSKRIIDSVSRTMSKYKTFYKGDFKFGLSSPGYIEASKNTPATFDGRKNEEPFSVHISAQYGLPLTEILSFSNKMDYTGNKHNGNVVDVMLSPNLIQENTEKIKLVLKRAFENGLFQIQINVIDSKTLIEAKKNPEKYTQLIVRVWGFSAYFNDLPESYKDLLIERALASENAA